MLINTIRSLRWTDILMDTLTAPSQIYEKIVRGNFPSLYFSVLIPIFVTFADTVTFGLLSEQTGFFYYKLSYGWMLSIIVILIRLVLYALLIDGVAQVMGHEGSFRRIFVLMNISLFPSLLVLPVVSIFSALNYAPLFFYALASLAAFVWSAYIIVRGLMGIHNISAGKSVWILVAPAVVGGVLAMFMLFLAILMLVSLAGLGTV
jgi:hypothetical protein